MAFKAPPPTVEERAALASTAGLCATCVYLQVLRSKRSTFVRCGRSDDDGAFARYPPLPVLACQGHAVPLESPRRDPPPG